MMSKASKPDQWALRPPRRDSGGELLGNGVDGGQVTRLRLVPLSRPAGELTVELNNRGEDPHNLNLRLEGEEGPTQELPETQSLQRSVATFELPAGSYRLWCSLPEHEEKGMYTSLQVE